MNLSRFVLLERNFDVSWAYGTRRIKLNPFGEGVTPTHVVSNLQEGSSMTTGVRPRHMGELGPRRSPKAQLLGLRVCLPPRRRVFH